MVIYLKALRKLTYHQALFVSLETHTGKPFKSQLADLLWLDKVLTPHCFQDTQLTGCPKDGMHVVLKGKRQDSCGRLALRASLFHRELPGEPSCAGATLLLPDTYCASCAQAHRSLHVLAILPQWAAHGQTQQMTDVARASHKLGLFGAVYLSPSCSHLTVPLLRLSLLSVLLE